MTLNIVEAVEAKITPDEITRVAQSTGETPNKTRRAMSTGVLAIIGGLIVRARTPEGAATLLSSIQAPARGAGLAPSLLGDRSDAITDAVASSSGVSRSAAIGIIGTLLPIVSGVIGREAIARRLDAGGVSDLLLSQRRLLLGHPNMPATLTGMFGGAEEVPSVPGTPERDVSVSTTPPVHRTVAPEHVAGRSRGWWLPLAAVGALLAGALLLFFARRPTTPTVSMPEQPRVEAPRVPPAPELQAPPAPAVPVPPGETTITGAEIKKEPSDVITEHFTTRGPLPDRVTLPGVTFDFNSANMVSGHDSIDKLAAAMKAHPSSRVRIEGHTDDVGNADRNAKLSYDRAATIRKNLADQGIDANRIEIIGKGAHVPIAPNDTEEGRAKNRRIEAVIVER